MPSLPSRLERFGTVDSTQRIVREWLAAGTPEVAIATADEQLAGRGRQGRAWTAPHGRALLLSAGFRPRDLALHHGWRLAAIAALAMLDAAERVTGLDGDTLWLKWPNDIVAVGEDGLLRKLAGVLGETTATGAFVETAIIGIGINADWPANEFPTELAVGMTSLRELTLDRPIDRDRLLDAYLARLGPSYESLLAGHFDAGGWTRRQLTTGRPVEVLLGEALVHGQATGVDPETGALLVRTTEAVIAIDSGEVTRCRLLDLPGRG
ncbi:MAG: biotin--[acetyl-CoA-carboxylase] ligase [Chloroflexi bacterium]|nr:biotin--[acetyl-CoA-carboxylase] ligase [Chloroflexota bacterium]